jgi:hypothetical protein
MSLYDDLNTVDDVDAASEDYPYIPRALLELVDFYSAPVVTQPHVREGKRDTVVGMMVLSGAEYSTLTGKVICPYTRGILVGAKVLWLKDINHFFKERAQCQQ